MLTSVTWLIRAGAYVLFGIDLFTHHAYGPVEHLAVTIAFGLSGALTLWGLLPVGLGDGTARRTTVLALAASVSSAVAVQPGATTLVGVGMIATIDAATGLRRSEGWCVFGSAVLAAEVGLFFSTADPQAAQGIPLLLAIGLLTGFNRRAYRVQAEQNKALLAQAERLRSEQRRVAVLDERTRIAREIHDVLAHSLGALGIQIQAARALLTDHQDTDRAIEVLTTAQRIASDGLSETRRAVHALRTDTPPLSEELARMAATHEQRHGSTVTLTVVGGAAPLPPDRALALVRTAQESLTNAAKHAPLRPVTVDLRYGDEDVTLTLTNPLGRDTPSAAEPPPDGTERTDGTREGTAGGAADGAPAGAAAGRGTAFATVDGGYGLTGMRERLLLLGGTLTAGPADGRWSVTACVPRQGRAAA
ncbi:sensor histidine kinase [Actinacidiphila reveromycinica]|uniref:sensor histidine kinase n=1 Tax=Actinacidiphila reveromycinica TaxID=659352 RepID=UPI001920E063|nr:histidine kinase [Streptomyces sp. SN-593]